MEIIDKYGYLEGALSYIDRSIISAKSLQKISKKSGVDEILLKNFKDKIKNFSEKYFLSILNEELEDAHSSLSGATAEVSGVDISIEKDGNCAYIFLRLFFDIMADNEEEDKTKIDFKIYSKNNIKIYVS